MPQREHALRQGRLPDFGGRGAVADLVAQFEPVPQMLKNVRYQAGADPLSQDSVRAEIARAEARLSGSGRVLIRKSGTEPLIRVMAEAEDEEAETADDFWANVDKRVIEGIRSQIILDKYAEDADLQVSQQDLTELMALAFELAHLRGRDQVKSANG